MNCGSTSKKGQLCWSCNVGIFLFKKQHEPSWRSCLPTFCKTFSLHSVEQGISFKARVAELLENKFLMLNFPSLAYCSHCGRALYVGQQIRWQPSNQKRSPCYWYSLKKHFKTVPRTSSSTATKQRCSKFITNTRMPAKLHQLYQLTRLCDGFMNSSNALLTVQHVKFALPVSVHKLKVH